MFVFFPFFRQISTYKASPDVEQAIITKQRLNRPISPHLSIYEFGMTMNLSSLHRITGVAMGFAFYGFTLSYALLPIVGIHVDAASLASVFGSLPLVAKLGIKAVAASPFAFHLWNGFRHLLWDSTRFVSKKGVYQTGYPVLALAIATTIGLAFL